MNADAIIQRINSAAKRLRASEKKLADDESQITSLRGLREYDRGEIDRLRSKVAEDTTQISRLNTEVAEDKAKLEENASEIERLTASQVSIREKAAQLKRDLDAKQKLLVSGYDKYNSGMTGFERLQTEYEALQGKHAKHLQDIERLKARIEGLTASESEAQQSALKAQQSADTANETAEKWKESNRKTAKKYSQLSLEYNELVKSTAKKNYAISTREEELTRAQASIAALEQEVEERDTRVKQLRGEVSSAKVEIRKLNTKARSTLLEHNKIVKERDNILGEKDALITKLQAAAQRQLTRLADMRQKAEDTGKQLKDLKGQLNECLMHKEKLEKKQSTLEATLEKSTTEQKLLKEKLKRKTEESKTKSAEKLRKRLDPNRDQPPPPAKLRKPGKPPVPQVRGAKVKRQIVVDYKERLKEVQKLLKQAVNDKNSTEEEIRGDKNTIASLTKQKNDVGTDGWNESDPAKNKAELQGRIDEIKKRLEKAKEKKKEAKETERKLRKERDKLRKEAKNKKEDLEKMRLFLKREGLDVKTDADVKELKRALKTYEYRADFTEFNKRLDQMTVDNADELVRELLGDVTAPPANPQANPQGFQQAFQFSLRF